MPQNQSGAAKPASDRSSSTFARPLSFPLSFPTGRRIVRLLKYSVNQPQLLATQTFFYANRSNNHNQPAPIKTNLHIDYANLYGIAIIGVYRRDSLTIHSAISVWTRLFRTFQRYESALHASTIASSGASARFSSCSTAAARSGSGDEAGAKKDSSAACSSLTPAWPTDRPASSALSSIASSTRCASGKSPSSRPPPASPPPSSSRPSSSCSKMTGSCACPSGPKKLLILSCRLWHRHRSRPPLVHHALDEPRRRRSLPRRILPLRLLPHRPARKFTLPRVRPRRSKHRAFVVDAVDSPADAPDHLHQSRPRHRPRLSTPRKSRAPAILRSLLRPSPRLLFRGHRIPMHRRPATRNRPHRPGLRNRKGPTRRKLRAPAIRQRPPLRRQFLPGRRHRTGFQFRPLRHQPRTPRPRQYRHPPHRTSKRPPLPRRRSLPPQTLRAARLLKSPRRPTRSTKNSPNGASSPNFTVELSHTLPLRDLLAISTFSSPCSTTTSTIGSATTKCKNSSATPADWLTAHPEKEQIVRRYLKHRRHLTQSALAHNCSMKTNGKSKRPKKPTRSEEEQVESKISLNDQRLDAVINALKESGATRVLDLGCSYGNLLRRFAGRETIHRNRRPRRLHHRPRNRRRAASISNASWKSSRRAASN